MYRHLFRALIGAYITHERGRTLLTVLGVALGVAVLIAIDLANESAVASFRDTMRDVAGRATLTVRGNGSGLPPALVPRLADTGGIRSVSPLINGQAAYVPTDGGTTVTLLLLGVDLLASTEQDAEPIRDLRFDAEPGRDFTSFLTDPGVVILTRRFAERHGIALGDHVRLLVAGTTREVVAGGLISGGTFADAVDGNIIVTDLGIADILLRRQGLLDRVDLTTSPGIDPDQLASELEGSLPGGVIVERPETRGRQVDDMIAAFRFNLRALGHISILVGAFLIYNTMSIAVARRRTVIGTVRAMGVSRGAVRAAFLAEGALLGAAGGLLGILGGCVLAAALLGTVSTSISLNFFQVQATRLTPAWDIVVASLAIGVATALLAAVWPAHDAAMTPPANTMRRGASESGGRAAWLLVGGAVACAAVAAGLLSLDPRPGLPIEGYLAATFLVGAFVLVSRPVLKVASAALRAPYSRLFGAEGLLAVSGVQGAPGRASVAVGGLLISLAMCVSVGVMVSSFRSTVVEWMGHVLHADLYVSGLPAVPGTPTPLLPARLAEAVERIPGVHEVDPFRARRVQIGGREAWLGAGRFETTRFSNLAADGRPAAEVLRRAREAREVIVSEAFSRKHGLRTGDNVAIPTPHGPIERRIAGVYYDYSTEQGFVIMDRGEYLEHFDDAQLDNMSVYLEEGADRAAVRRAIAAAAAATPDAPDLLVRSNDELRRFAIKAFDQTFTVTYVLQVIAIIVSVLGVTSTLLAQILDRRQEILTLRYIGAARGRVARIVVLESSLIGIAGVALGVGAGLGLSWILTRVIMLQSFGWTIAFSIPWLAVAQVALLVFAATLLAGWLPSREAGRHAADTMRTQVG